jgi:predicted flap endonuclease-1-like 5' DNA nuclease
MPAHKRRPRSLKDITGIGKRYIQRLRGQGIKSTQELVNKASTPRERRKLTTMTGIENGKLHKWSKQAELLMINGIGVEYVALLAAAGIDSAPELALCDARALHNALVNKNNEKHLVKRIPSVHEVSCWIKQALKLPHASKK